MTVSQDLNATEWAARLPDTLRGDLDNLETAYFRHVDKGGAVDSAPTQVFREHVELALQRAGGGTAWRVYRPGDGAGIGAAVQIVIDDMPLLVKSVTSTLARLGASLSELIHPIFESERDDAGRLLHVAPHEADGTASGFELRESWMHLQLHPSTEPELLDRIEEVVPELLAEVRQVVDDSEELRGRTRDVADELDRVAAGGGEPFDPARLSRCADLMRWLSSGHFTLLGYARYADDEDPIPGTALGVLRAGAGLATGIEVPGPVGRDDESLLMLTQGSEPAMVYRSVHPYFVGLSAFDEAGKVIGRHVFVGVFTVSALHENVLDIPVIERRVRDVIERAGFDIDSFSGQAMLEVIQSFPRSELFSASTDALFTTTTAVLDVNLRRELRLFLREDTYRRFVSCLVYLPRDRYNTRVRLSIQDILVRELGGESIEYSARVTESDFANLHFTVRPGGDSGVLRADTSEANRLRIQELIAEASRSWDDHLGDEVAATDELEPARAQHYADAFPEAYKEDFDPRRAVRDILRLEQLQTGAIDLRLYRNEGAERGNWRLGLYIGGGGVSLSHVLPVLHSLGVEVLDERPYSVELADGSERWIYDFGLVAGPELLRGALGPDFESALVETADADEQGAERIQSQFTAAFAAIWFAKADADNFNELVLRAGLHWREAAVLRAYAKYLRQVQFPYVPSNIARVLLAHPEAAQLFVELFTATFDPDRASAERAAEVEARLRQLIDEVVSLDVDRIMRAILGLIKATLRTNYFITDTDGEPQPYLAFKLEPDSLDELPRPRPKYEVFVYSPRVEGVHLRFGSVARGGLRWSDRLEDYRTEILGLVKAQAVKNAVIVPVGAKGGFVVKNPPVLTDDESAYRQALREEGIACYRLFISGLLDLTDNLDHSTRAVVPPDRVVRRDGDDTYLVVAADKGTATFSDTANEVAHRYGYWLGDAFASGGSVGYDHKEMGITARGAWESVKRHFREMDRDTQSEDFTVVGVGDMSGDVFGNGMLLSDHIRIVAAFDHRHIFLDPDPDAAQSVAERRRLFGLQRSSWADYDTDAISTGGGVWERTRKSIPVSPQARTALGLGDDVSALPPPEIIKAILRAPVDLLWNGGIGTYIKASSESNADAGDKSNDAVRVDAIELRAKVVGEGGNLGVTALGRIEFARNGGRINTDALDNSAGVDCSDHEVNIKILLDRLVIGGQLQEDERNSLLVSMTDEVGRLVLADNISQNYLLGLARFDAVEMLNVYRRVIADLERNRALDRELEALPSEHEIGQRRQDGQGLTSPELATLMAHVKMSLKADLLASDLPDSRVFGRRLPGYFPAPLRERFATAIGEHPLSRQIVAMLLTNEVVDHGGISYAYRLAEEAGANTTDAVRAFDAATEVFGLHGVWDRIRSASAPTSVLDDLELESKRTLDRASRWFLTNRPQPLAVGAEINRYRTRVGELASTVPEWMRGWHVSDTDKRAQSYVQRGAPEELANEVTGLLNRFPLLDIVDIADITDRDGDEVGSLYYALYDHLGIDWMLVAVTDLARGDRWHALARLALRDDLYGAMRALTMNVLVGGEPDEDPNEKIAYWESTNQSRLARARTALAEIFESGTSDLATLSVAARQVRSMISGVGSQSEVAR
ncbi:NAD-glutamate dehydrogenase [Aldersonia sp. NBC_00410]|uniref:NAD-glutamate dehydrogenase n=1 Tax=Aldersonia sp. NBC_00410 TaxID=2975954 RepID=UPI002256243B|nr:NAD-glutamate dehydrogenase [Aldersonia sp. NBC_00410]MCX5042816.1 NAD-glutamate dehydrogenase [Aldersonia sp. NBC_00410]